MRSFLAVPFLLSSLGSSSPIDIRSASQNDIRAPEQTRVGYFDGDTFYSPPFAPPRWAGDNEVYEDNDSPISDKTFPDWPTTHLLARRLLAVSSTAVLSTVYPKGYRDSTLEGTPIGLPDYIADCSAHDNNVALRNILGRGNPLLLALNVGTTFRNAKAGSKVSLSVDWWQHSRIPPKGGDPLDRVPAGLPRLSLIGRIEEIPLDSLSKGDRQAVEQCFLQHHSDAKYWLPGSPKSPHSGYWARLVVEKAFWVGGFGDRARIGWLDMDTWKAIPENSKDGKKGWADIKLPGE
ncbi:hypothetical protein MGYG_03523 [Nannizzia gypsea CBS 118893]|uniref:CREG-like beta-barrel domain-containing protein n=1 Tax=Arthroderma gypseum (strain ATCC MYA-4604 / CBS 118893) TaxID=535722 RepID=E4USF2_ARTGP|nr:hypothetical protein MGYG_03523 [Nannizzia gypsea CBS 118893]EFR00519.1 hypothetical protein MGYG_03523 [Nannizzia gypsea CBS 118893]